MSDGILLRGLDGSNPLAFLAALGTLRTLSLALPDETVRISWQQHDGAWRPRVYCSLDGDSHALVAALDDELLKADGRPSFAIGDNLNLPAGRFRQYLLQAVADPNSLVTPQARIDADFLAAFGSEVITADDGTMTDTALRTMSGAGHQHFLKFFRELVRNTGANHVRRALLLPWDYSDGGRGMNLRWDPADDRRYALRWDDPSSDPSTTMRGANRLAIEALPLLPTAPARGELATTAFHGKGARDTFLTWPIWSTPINCDVARSLLTADVKAIGSRQREALGLDTAFTSARITTGKFRNLTPSMPV